MRMIPTLTTDRLILRAPMESDFPAHRAFMASEHSAMVGGPSDEWQAWRGFMANLGHWTLRGFGFWTIALKSDNAPIGKTGFVNHPMWDEPELGWHLYEEHLGQNYAFEATSAARAYGPKFGLDGVISYIDPANERSLHLATRLGAKLERLGELLGRPAMIYRHPKVGG